MTNEEMVYYLEHADITVGQKCKTKTAEAIEKALKMLKLEQQRWIPVSERLPEKEGLYLVSVKNEHDRIYSKTCWFHGNSNWFARQDVIAWMPLPQPYTESEDKE